MIRRESAFLYPIISILLGFIVLVAVLMTGIITINSEGVRSRYALESVYRRSYYDMCDSVNNLEINLSKLMVTSAKSESVPLISEVSAQAELASSSLSSLPFEQSDVIATEKYFNQVGDWCRSYARAIIKKSDVTSYREQAHQLYYTIRSLNERLRAISIDNGMISGQKGENVLLPQGYNFTFTSEQTQSIEYPELIYDGPFSDAKKHTWYALDSKKNVSEKEAKEVVKKLNVGDIDYIGKTEGESSIYQFIGKTEGDDIFVSVTEQGAMIVGYERNKTVNKAELTQNQAQQKAVDYAKEIGYGKLSVVWYNAQEGIGYVNLAPEIDGVIYYPDLVKVKIALDDGTLLGIEASGYCANHRPRSFSALISEKTARSLVSEKLHVKNVRLAVIPDDVGGEWLCYEVNGVYEGLDYFVYVDAIDGTERDILRVVDNEQGTLVM